MTGLVERWRGTGLRARLVLGVVAITGVTMLLVGVALTVSLRAYLVDRIDDGLADRMPTSVAGAGDHDDGVDPVDAGRSRGPGTVTFAVDGPTVTAQNITDLQGTLITDQPGSISTADRAAITALAASKGVHTVDLSSLGEYRLVAAADPDVPGGRLVLGTSLHSVDATIGQLVLVLSIALVIALATAAGLAWFVVGRSLRPLRAVAATATQVAATPLASGDVRLDQRVPSMPPGTEVGQLSQAFNTMLEHVEGSLQQREESEERLRRFVGDASHELRTPIAAIRGWAELVRRAGGQSADQAAVSARRIESAAARMGVLVDDLLLLARLDAGRPLARQPVGLRALLSEVFAEASIAGADKEWTLRAPADAIVAGDELALHQAVANLLANARVHTPPGTHITVTLGRSSAADGDLSVVTITVEDDGPGIPADLLPTVTERFTKGDESRSRSAGGTTGLGLAITSSVVSAHGGTLVMSSGAGTGTRACIELPAMPVERPLTTAGSG